METLLAEIKKSVSFIFIPNDKGVLSPQGTGFFMGVRVGHSDQFRLHFVSTKHVLQDAMGHYFPSFYLRLTKLSGDSELICLNTKDLQLSEHPDPDVDLVMFPLVPDARVVDFKFIPSDLITERHHVKEGQDVFFSGLFLSHVGQNKNQPIIRFGKVALISDEKIEWHEHFQTKYLDLYLLECQSFAGNSGSPVFYRSDPNGPILLAGVIKGSFAQTNPVSSPDNTINLISFQNVGISAVTPATKLKEILDLQPSEPPHANH